MNGPTATDERAVEPRARWRAVAVPSEHGGWGLTAEPVLLGLLIASSWAGVAIGVAAVLAFLIRAPLKLALVDGRRRRTLPRMRAGVAHRNRRADRARRGDVAGGGCRRLDVDDPAGGRGADVRHRAVVRRPQSRSGAAPELCGGVGITAVTAAIVIVGGGATTLAVAASLVLAARAIGSIPYVRMQIERLRHGPVTTTGMHRFQVAAVVVALSAVAVGRHVALGAAAVVALVVAQVVWSRRPVPPARVVGMRQLVLGLIVVAVTALGVHA